MTDRARPAQYADGLMDAMIVVAEVSGPMKMADFNEATWAMLCRINERLAAKAADAFRVDANDGEQQNVAEETK